MGDTHMLQALAEDILSRVRAELSQKVAELSQSSPELVREGEVWELWRAVFDAERKMRAEWVGDKLESESEELRLRAAFGDDYEAWLDEETDHARRVVASYVRLREQLPHVLTSSAIAQFQREFASTTENAVQELDFAVENAINEMADLLWNYTTPPKAAHNSLASDVHQFQRTMRDVVDETLARYDKLADVYLELLLRRFAENDPNSDDD